MAHVFLMPRTASYLPVFSIYCWKQTFQKVSVNRACWDAEGTICYQGKLLSLMEKGSALWRCWPMSQAEDISAAQKLHHLGANVGLGWLRAALLWVVKMT